MGLVFLTVSVTACANSSIQRCLAFFRPTRFPLVVAVPNERQFARLVAYMQQHPRLDVGVACHVGVQKDWPGLFDCDQKLDVRFRDMWLMAKVRNGRKTLRPEGKPGRYKHLWPLAGKIWATCGDC